MHDQQGFFCKTAISGIKGKNTIGKKHAWAETGQPNSAGGTRVLLTMGLGPDRRGGDWASVNEGRGGGPGAWRCRPPIERGGRAVLPVSEEREQQQGSSGVMQGLGEAGLGRCGAAALGRLRQDEAGNTGPRRLAEAPTNGAGWWRNCKPWQGKLQRSGREGGRRYEK